MPTTTERLRQTMHRTLDRIALALFGEPPVMRVRVPARAVARGWEHRR